MPTFGVLFSQRLDRIVWWVIFLLSLLLVSSTTRFALQPLPHQQQIAAKVQLVKTDASRQPSDILVGQSAVSHLGYDWK
jgi:hypothetical protein